jgi:hypothetical protein
MSEIRVITFNLAEIPREIRDDLARPLAIAVDAYFKQPGVEEAFQAWLVDYKKRKVTQADNSPAQSAQKSKKRLA